MTEQKKQNVLEAPLVMEGNINVYSYSSHIVIIAAVAAHLLEDFSNDYTYLLLLLKTEALHGISAI